MALGSLTEGRMQSHIRPGKLRRDLCLVFRSFFSLAIVYSIAFVCCCTWLDSIIVSDISLTGMRFVVSLLFPLLAPFAVASNGRRQSNSTGYVVKTPPLTTPWTDEVGTNPWPEYPRPQLQRSEWLNLNGIWTYQNASSLDAVNSPPFNQTLPNEVLVPSCLESGLSGRFSHPLKNYTDTILQESRALTCFILGSRLPSPFPRRGPASKFSLISELWIMRQQSSSMANKLVSIEEDTTNSPST